MLATPELWEAWLDATRDGRAVRELLGPVASERLAVRPANPLVNSALNEGPGCIDGIEAAA